MAHDLVVEPLFSWRDRQRRRDTTTLPGLLAKLSSGELVDFPRVRTHQLDPWCMFLTQLAAIALRRAGQSDPPADEAQWRGLVLALTHGAHEPWTLVVDDLSEAAFFQPPVPELTVDDWSSEESPDEIDVLMTAKGHDLKGASVHADQPEAWAYSLCTLQTMQGYPGRGYNRISRMNGGYGNRARVGLAPSDSLSARFICDVGVLLGSWPALIDRGFREEGIALVWIEPWDGRTSLATAALCPHFIEVCWRVRLRTNDRSLSCCYTTTAVRRCVPEVENGDVGDPWIPIERAGARVSTIAC